MKKCFLMFLIAFTLFSSPIHAKTMYVTNKLVVTVRIKPSSDSKTVDRLTSDIKVDLLKTEGSWAKISFKDNMTGWMLERFLTEETPKPFQVSELKKAVAEKTVKIETLEKENRALDLRKKELEERISSLSQESQKLKEEPYRIVMLLAGGGIFLTGCIVTLIILRIGRMDYGITNLKKRILNKKYQ